MAKKTITVQETEISLLVKQGDDDFISLTDIDQKFEVAVGISKTG